MLRRQSFTFLIHIALAIIVAGAFVTHFTGIQGELSLRDGAAPVTSFDKSSGPGDGSFPFAVSLRDAEVVFYPGTTTPMDFKSVLDIDGRTVTVSMNNVAEVAGWRFFQSGMSPEGSVLSVSYDPWGTGITYLGYALLGLGMIGFFFQKHTAWRSLLRKKSLAVFLLLFSCSLPQASAYQLPAMQRPLAANLGKAYVYWNDRVCPMQTMARDVSLKLYKSDCYKGLTSEQVLSGWLFYFDEWLRDYETNFPLAPDASEKSRKAHAENMALIRWLGTGEAFRIYPYHTRTGHMEWLSLAGRKPSAMSFEQWRFMQTTMPDMKKCVIEGRNIRANEIISSLIEGQRRYAGAGCLPSEAKMTAERIYNDWARPLPAAILSFLTGAFWIWAALRHRPFPRLLRIIMWYCVLLVFVYITAMLAVLWWIGGHAPLSNGPEIMLFMAFVSLGGALLARTTPILRGALVSVAAMTLFVAVMGGRTPRIGMLMPILASPLLSIHVMLVMTSYVLFLLMAILSALALLSHNNPQYPTTPISAGPTTSSAFSSATPGSTKFEQLARYNRIILLPAVFLLAAGIFVGAVWANQSWGRYWGWDPKETCALITLCIYSLPLHWSSPRLKYSFSPRHKYFFSPGFKTFRIPAPGCFRNPQTLHWYLLISILSVLFTYFGANYLLPGLHSYA